MKKQLLGILAIALSALSYTQTVGAQTPQENRLILFTDAGKLQGISGNARWAAGYLSHDTGFLINLESETVISLLGGGIVYSEAVDVSDDGVVVGLADGLPACWDSEGKSIALPLPPGDFVEGVASSISDDGKYIAGYVFGAGFSGVPLRWVRQDDGTYQFQKLKVLAKDLFGKKPLGGFYVDAMSSDGMMMVGRMSDNEYGWFPALWRNVETTPEPVIFGKEFQMDDNGRWNNWNAEPYGFTVDNKFIIGVITDNTESFGPSYALLYDIEQDKMELPKVKGDLFCLMTKDKKMISASPAGFPYRSAFINEPGKEGRPLEEYVKEHFGVNMLDQMDGSGTLMNMSADEKSIVGFAGYNGSAMGGFCLRMGGPDATKINNTPLTKPQIYTIEEGSIVVKNVAGATVTLSDMSGKVLNSTIADADVVLSAAKGQVYIVRVAYQSVSYIHKVAVK